MADQDAIETKLAAARTRLIIDKPFLGALVLRLPLKKANPDWCKTTATDAKSFFYNPDYIAALNLSQTEFILAHEALHCALSHFARREHRIKHRWDIACDYAINPILKKDGLVPPPGALLESSYENMTAEEIYPYIKDNDNSETLDHHMYDDSGEGKSDQGKAKPNDNPDTPQEDKADNRPPEEGQDPAGKDDQQDERGQDQETQSESESDNGAPPPAPLTPQEKEALSVQWQQRMAGAAQTAMQAGKLGADMARLVDFLLQPQLPWRMLLARYMTQIARDDYSYTRPSTRRGDPAVFPSLRSAQLDIAVALDTSGSISATEMNEFIAEIDAIKGQMRARITLQACDAKLAEQGPWVFEPWETFELPKKLSGGGGTLFTPVFEWAERQDKQPDLLVYFTDAEGEFPKVVPNFPVLWLVKGKHPVPWGQRVQLN